jgi:hypothetical protein
MNNTDFVNQMGWVIVGGIAGILIFNVIYIVAFYIKTYWIDRG